jgi:TRAP-type C4-dicarboxylate transport system permease small subunit
MADKRGAESNKDETKKAPEAADVAAAVEKRALAEPAIAKKAWGEPLARFDKKWTNFESRLCAWVLMAEVVALCLWIALKGLSAEYQTTGEGDKNVSGVVFRALITATFLGLAAHRVTRPKVGPDAKGFAEAEQRHRVVVTTAVILGLAGGRLWANGGVGYFSNLLNWMQGASLLTLIGGLRGVATRLTLWLALLGASIATAKGKHINIDVVMRFLSPRMRVPVALVGWIAAAVMCTAGAWGFVDHIAIALFHAPPSEPCKDDPKKDCRVSGADKLSHVGTAVSTDMFLVGRQISLDLKSLPHVIAGTHYNEWMKGSEWNAWIKDGSWTDHFPQAEVDGLLATPERLNEFHVPAVSIPGGEEVHGLLIKDADFVFPFGMFMIAVRFILRCLLVLSGQLRVDPDMAHEEEEVEDAHPDSEAALKVVTSAKGKG